MRTFWYWSYNLVGSPLFWIVLHLGGLVNRKIRRGIAGRRDLFEKLARQVEQIGSGNRIWFHSSSLGEFEQAKPIIAALRRASPEVGVVVSFFSPSGYDHSQSYKLADVITYIPFDSAANARRFLDIVKPSAAVMVRYDVWPNHLWELRRRNVPIFIANATLRPTSARLLWPIRSFHHYLYEDLTAILTVSEADRSAFERFALRGPRLQVVGDTRYDQVWQRSEEARTKHIIPPQILRGKKTLVVGSSWPDDEAVILPAFRRVAQHDAGALMILVPHEPSVETLERLELELSRLQLRTVRFSDLNDYSNENVILVDSIGILMSLYQYADVAYVGGSFKQGIHNVLEPAVYGIPVLFGPRHDNSQEARVLAERGGAFVVTNIEDTFRVMRKMFNDKGARSAAGNQALQLVKQNVGATERFLTIMRECIPLRR